jgi:hypothetical protein
MLWLAAVEGIEPTEAAGVIGVHRGDADELAARAGAGLRTQWARDRVDAGEVDPVAPAHLEAHLQTVLPLPIELFELVDARWRDRQRRSRRRPTVAGLALPGGRPLPRWAEHSLIAGTAALIALGITSAVVVDRDAHGGPSRGRQLADGTTPTTLSHAESANLDDGPMAAFEEDDGPDVRVASVGRPRDGASAGGAVAAVVSGASSTAPAPAAHAPAPTTTTTAPPLLQVNAGVGPTLALAVGDCTGVELGGQVVGCEPDPNTGVHLGGTLLGR